MYPSVLPDVEWAFFKHYFEPDDGGPSAHIHDKGKVVCAVGYVARGDIQWHMAQKVFAVLGKPYMPLFVAGTNAAYREAHCGDYKSFA